MYQIPAFLFVETSTIATTGLLLTCRLKAFLMLGVGSVSAAAGGGGAAVLLGSRSTGGVT